MSPRASPLLPTLLALGWVALCGLAACGADDGALPPELADVEPSGVRVLLVGIDGATFNVLDPLLEAGRLPVFSELIARGTTGRLRSEEPMKSPAIWTTIATGRPRSEHGVVDFTSAQRSTPGDPALVASVDRRTLALWNLVGPFERTVLSVGWWVTWPAEPVNGDMVSDRLARSRWMSWAGGEADVLLTWPRELQDELAHLVVDPMDPPLEEIARLVELTPEEQDEMLAAETPIPFHGPSVMKFGFCQQLTYERVALELLGRGQPDLTMVFLIAVDPISHTFWHYYEPEKFDGEVDPALAARLGAAIPAIYVHDDAALGRLLEAVDDDTVVLVVSDHGFRASGVLPRETQHADLRVFGIDRSEQLERPVNVGMTGVHKLNGVLIAAGGPILRDARFRTQPTVADVAPTVLALMGLPVPDDMSGRVLDEMIDPAFLARHPVQRTESYESVIFRPDMDVPEADQELHRSYLKALGYTD